METIEINKENALKAYNNADKKGKALLEDLFGKQTFIEKITDTVKTFEDACSLLDIDENDYEKHLSIKEEASVNAYRKLIIIISALNEGWKPDWNNSDEYKYYCWFKMKSESGFSNADCGYAYMRTYVCSRLCFKTKELAEYAGKQFEDIYEEYLTN